MKTRTKVELAIMGYFLVGGLWVFATRNDPHTTLTWHGEPLPPPPVAIDTPRTSKAPPQGEFPLATQHLFDSIDRARERRKPKNGPFTAAETRLVDSLMNRNAEKFWRAHPPTNTGPKLSWKVTKVTVIKDSTHAKNNKLHGKH